MGFFLLLESALGYVLFKRNDADAIARDTHSVQQSITKYNLFNKMVSFVGFAPFESPEHGLDNINAVSEGVLHEHLANFLEQHLAGQEDSQLGMLDSKLAGAVQDALSVKCLVDDQSQMLLRGCRLHLNRFLKDVKESEVHKAQIGLGHAYSRAKVKFNINKADNMIIQSIAMLDQLDKDLNTFSMRLKEWYSWHFPELSKIVKDNYHYARIVALIKDKSSVSEENLHALTEILGDESIAEEVIAAAKSSMGLDLGEFDMLNIEAFADRVVSLSEYRATLSQYLNEKMHSVAPNLASLLGEIVGARLVAHAGSMVNLAKYPASTVQILGAEKALFRALKTRGKTPKYGLLFNSSFIGRASKPNKGRISRFLANKASLAARLDVFQDFPTSKYGEAFRKQVEERLNYLESGGGKDSKLQKNIDVVRSAKKEVEAEIKHHEDENEAADTTVSTPKPKKRKSISSMEVDSDSEAEADAVETPSKKSKKSKKDKKEKKKKSKKRSADEDDGTDEEMAEVSTPKKKKKKSDSSTPKSDKKKKKKSKKDKKDKKKKSKKAADDSDEE